MFVKSPLYLDGCFGLYLPLYVTFYLINNNELILFIRYAMTYTTTVTDPVAGYSFPIDEGNNEYPAQITFQQVIIPPLRVDSFINDVKRIVVDENGNKTAAGDIPQIENLDIQTIKRSPRSGNGPFQIQLYLPQAINFRDGVAYQDVQLGAIGSSIEAGIKSGTGLGKAAFDAVVNEGSGLIDGLVNGITNDAGALGALKVASKINDTAASAVSSATRVALNPNARTLFQSVPIRSFTFQFKLVPNNAREVTRIESIIKKFREALYPEEIGFDQIALGYKFPDPFEIKMYYNDEEIFTRILPSYLRDVSVTYNSQGMGFYRDGGFTDAEISLTFTEMRPLNKTDVREQGY